MDWGDYDGDGFRDVAVTGASVSDTAIVYWNDGGSSFTATQSGLSDVQFGSVEWGDYDGDGDLDLVTTGLDTSSTPITTIYRNDGEDFAPSAPPTVVANAATFVGPEVYLSWEEPDGPLSRRLSPVPIDLVLFGYEHSK